MTAGTGGAGSRVVVGRVAAVRRYPVKSLVGEDCERAEIDPRGLVGDRLWAVRTADGKLGSGKDTRRFRRVPGLLELAARSGPAGVPVVELPDGHRWAADDPAAAAALSERLGRPVTLARESAVPHHDDGPVHLLTTATLTALAAELGRPVDLRRLRPNLVVDTGPAGGFVEDGWLGRRVCFGAGAVLAVRAPTPRCVMVDLPQVGLPAGGGVLKAVHRANGGDLGVVADVVVPGWVALGDEVWLDGPD